MDARDLRGAQHGVWDDGLEKRLETEWEEARATTGKTWDQIEGHVRRGYERSRRTYSGDRLN
ncbi:MAG: hypothetical protein JST00_21645 [Deltaproteobacteria bacterium]|nr:hypothetical protein [Deltaproteobacteria bacterium]